jgi:dsRNA-specific ribonuclease|tara:strand:- start:537 stop:1400 length:864 start_codon:yes stop_codon:yes gene_type:complete
MEESSNPYNENNIEIKEETIREILNTYGVYHNIQDIELWKRSFVNSSYVKQPFLNYVQLPYNCIELKQHSNERLEFIGDGILENITKYYLYKRFPDADEGFMTEKKINLVRNEHIGKLAYKMGIHKWLLISKQSEEKKNRTNYKKLGCLFESFLGALFLDTNEGFKVCQIFLESIFNLLVDWTEIIENDDNYKNIFQVKIQKEFKCTPQYKILHQNEELKYTMGVFLSFNENEPIKEYIDFDSIGSFDKIKDTSYKTIHFGTGVHKIKKKAEQLACLEALKKIDKYK